MNWIKFFGWLLRVVIIISGFTIVLKCMPVIADLFSMFRNQVSGVVLSTASPEMKFLVVFAGLVMIVYVLDVVFRLYGYLWTFTKSLTDYKSKGVKK
jgi:hypothetical protein